MKTNCPNIENRPSFFEYSTDVNEAIQKKRPILALESTLITHGLPYPENVQIACELERIAKECDVVPATIAVMNGKIKIGLSRDDIENLVRDKNVIKASSADIPYALAQNINAGTTVSGTLFCASRAGIKIFATGGIGGVHRGNDGDISADLIELSRTPMAVICAGAKAILDIPRTLEFLETYGVPVVGYRTEQFPGFYTTHTSCTVPKCVDDMAQLVSLLSVHWELQKSSGILIANPIPSEHHIPKEVIEPVIEGALQEAREQNIMGKNLTPFLLKRVVHATKGRSLCANIALLKNNVRLGAQLAKALTIV